MCITIKKTYTKPSVFIKLNTQVYLWTRVWRSFSVSKRMRISRRNSAQNHMSAVSLEQHSASASDHPAIMSHMADACCVSCVFLKGPGGTTGLFSTQTFSPPHVSLLYQLRAHFLNLTIFSKHFQKGPSIIQTLFSTQQKVFSHKHISKLSRKDIFVF